MSDLATARRDTEDNAQRHPPMVGLDERRMQVRAYNAWSSLLGARQWPNIEELDLASLDFADRSVLLDCTAGGDNPAIVYLGQMLRDEGGIHGHLHRLDDVPSASLISRLTNHYSEIFSNNAPIGFEAEYENPQGVEILYRGILLPFSTDDETIDFILGVINWKEGAPAQRLENSPIGLVSEDRPLTLVPALDPILSPSLDSVMSAPMPSYAAPVWADGPSSLDHHDGGALSLPSFGDNALHSRLSDARIFADQARDSDDRSRMALYRAIGKAWDFALAAEERPALLAELLKEAGLKVQKRAPFTPIIKLVFGADYEKSRIAEYAAVLRFAQEQSFDVGTLESFIAAYDGGLKALLRNIRAERRAMEPAEPKKIARHAAAVDQWRSASPAAMISHDRAAMGDQEFVLLIGRVTQDGQVAVVGHASDDEALVQKAMSKALPLG